jgi:hypothetical protein
MKDINGKLCTRAEWDALEKDPEQLYIVEDQAGVTLYLGSRPVSSERLTGECEGGMLQAVSQDRATAQLSAASANASAATAGNAMGASLRHRQQAQQASADAESARDEALDAKDATLGAKDAVLDAKGTVESLARELGDIATIQETCTTSASQALSAKDATLSAKDTVLQARDEVLQERYTDIVTLTGASGDVSPGGYYDLATSGAFTLGIEGAAEGKVGFAIIDITSARAEASREERVWKSSPS